MDSSDLLPLVFRWLHIIPAMIMVGGALFMRFALLPAYSEFKGASLEDFKAAIRKRWARAIMASSGLLLISGGFNTVLTLKQDVEGGFYHPLLGIKILLALAVFFLASLLSGRSGLAQKIQRKQAFWLNINAILAVAIVCIAGALKFAPRAEESPENPEQSSQSAPLHPARG